MRGFYFELGYLYCCIQGPRAQLFETLLMQGGPYLGVVPVVQGAIALWGGSSSHKVKLYRVLLNWIYYRFGPLSLLFMMMMNFGT